MKFGSLFSGIGGLDLGLERAGMTCSWQVEIDPYCRQVLTKHWPDVPKFPDVRRIDGRELGRVDLVCGGFPCQPVSVAGKRRAQEDERWLWPEFARVVRLVRPRYVLVENVPGLRLRGMGDVLGDLADLGYDAEWESIPAAAFGAPHLRWRIFIVAHSISEPVRMRPGGLDGAAGEGEGEAPQRERLWPNSGDGSSGEGDVAYSSSPRYRTGQPGTSWEIRDEARRQESQRRRRPMADSEKPRLEGRVFGGHAQQGLPRPWQSSGPVGQIWESEPNVGRVAHGVPQRVERLRGLGNAVVPQVAEWIGRRILEFDSEVAA